MHAGLTPDASLSRMFDYEGQTLALIAHDALKDEMVAFASEHFDVLSRFARRVATGTTGGGSTTWPGRAAGPRQALGTSLPERAAGRRRAIAELVLEHQCQRVIFFEDPHVARQHEADIQLLERAVRVVTESATCATSPSVARRWAQAVESAEPETAGWIGGRQRSRAASQQSVTLAAAGFCENRARVRRMRRVHSAAGHQWPGHLVQRKEDAMMQAVSFARICAGLAGAVLLSASLAAKAADKVYFVEPKDGATVASPVKVKFGVDGMAVKPAGDMSAGSGHHHLIVDGKPVPRARSCRRTTRTSTLARARPKPSSLAPGKHTLTMQFADGAHRSYGPDLSSTISVTVK